MYSKKVIERFKNPKFAKEIKDPDGVGKVGNTICGDVLEISIKVENNKIIDIGWRTFGCVAAIAASDQLCELALGKTIEQAEKITEKQITKGLEGLPPEKIHCSVLGARALKQAIKNYKKK